MTTARWLNDQEQELWRLLLAAVRYVDRGMDMTLQDGHGISVPEFAVLVHLSESNEKETRLRDLCASLNWDRSRTSHQITRMERRGLVVKQKCSDDGRGVIVELTAEGRRRLESAAPEHVERVRELFFDKITDEEMQALRPVLERILGEKQG
ncbi:MarR family winged helix-turn-helix transcriptional regulator [Corynebacterium freiburgense]|uniref:MarR family winged helix-turn-helix transcriptional regulator n=1 Tax=Corynebacterium freiburgense TaxID=556548 RepID=UPI0003F84FA2|nr:MarR family winged helix-turn-helix transcriptional regulator [Corynebacterium freiburgense]WJZ02337.1 Transcriptional regulator SarA [Corynebacterium freiburgense]